MGATYATLSIRENIAALFPKRINNNVERSLIVWLDDSINDNKQYIDIQQKLLDVINHLQTFQDIRKCKKYIKSIHKDDRILLIVNDRLGRELVPQVHSFRHITSIYVYNNNHTTTSEWTKQFIKIKDVINNPDVLVAKIRSDQATIRYRTDEPIVINIFNPNSSQGQTTTELNGKFIHSEVSIDVLLRMKSSSIDKNELIQLCKEQYKNDEAELAIIHEFEKTYSSDRALWWYTRNSFLYRLLNKALRLQNIDMLFLFRFFIRDIERQLEQYKCSTPIRLYRGQLLSNEELQLLKKSIGQFISMNSFLSTSVDREQALRFLNHSDASKDLQRVLFTIDADPHLEGVKPFANITAYSYFPFEQEVLIMLGSIFQLIDIRRDQQIWLIRVKLCGANNHESKPMLAFMKNQYVGGDGQTDLLSFGTALSEMGKFDDAEKYFRRLLSELPRDHPGISDCYHNLGEIASEKGDYDTSLIHYNKSLEIRIRTLESNHPDLAESYNSIGIIHRKKGDNKSALISYHKALAIFKRAYGEDHPKTAKCFNNIGNAYLLEKKYIDALEYYHKASDIQQTHLPADHPDLGSSHSNIGGAYRCLGQSERALEHYKTSLKILEKSLPPQHPSIAMTLKNIGVVYEDKDELKQALTYFENAAKIRRQTLPSTHPHVRQIEDDIRRVSIKLKTLS